MLEAKSMYHGGEIVEAIDVNLDFDSYKELGLLCPFCSEPVFLCGETVKQSRKTGKLSYVQPHFKHFPGGDPLELTCEKRYYTAEGKRYIDALRSERRGQRLDLFNRYFWEMVRDGLRWKGSARQSRHMLNQVSKKINMEFDFDSAVQNYINFVNSSFFSIQFVVDYYASREDALAKRQEWSENEFELAYATLEFLQLESLKSHVDIKLQSLIVYEASLFLAQKKARPVLKAITMQHDVNNFCYAAEKYSFNKQAVSDYILEESSVSGYNTFRLLSVVNWQQQLEEKAKLKEQTRGKGFGK